MRPRALHADKKKKKKEEKKEEEEQRKTPKTEVPLGRNSTKDSQIEQL